MSRKHALATTHQPTRFPVAVTSPAKTRLRPRSSLAPVPPYSLPQAGFLVRGDASATTNPAPEPPGCVRAAAKVP
jgi:hypothetical protein